jgi:hypothetical protein
MKKILLLHTIALTLLSCAPQNSASEPVSLEGVWDRIGTIVYEGGAPKDTVALQPLSKQVKFYSANHFIFVGNGENLDSLGVDKNIGFSGNGTYEVKNDSLFEYMKHGTDNYLKWIANGNKIFTAKISLSEDYFTQYQIDSLGNGMGEFYQKLE